jgi:hypothetical protein
VGSCAGDPSLYPYNETYSVRRISFRRNSKVSLVYARARCGLEEGDSAARASHRERAVKGCCARAAKRASKSRSKVPVLSAGGALLGAVIFEAALVAASTNIRARLRVTITAATVAFELASSCLSEVGLAFTRFVPPAVRF